MVSVYLAYLFNPLIVNFSMSCVLQEWSWSLSWSLLSIFDIPKCPVLPSLLAAVHTRESEEQSLLGLLLGVCHDVRGKPSGNHLPLLLPSQLLGFHPCSLRLHVSNDLIRKLWKLIWFSQLQLGSEGEWAQGAARHSGPQTLVCIRIPFRAC